jgi:hypothetical protein
MTVLFVLDATARRRSSATLPAATPGARRRNKGMRYPPTRRRSRRSWRSCATPPMTVTAEVT